jgi:hypothetical protein
VVTLSSMMEGPNTDIQSAQSLIPVVTLAVTVNATEQQKASSHSLIPVVTLALQAQKDAAEVSKDKVMTMRPRVTLLVTVREVGDVDRIEITSRPTGRIEIRNA